MQRSDPSDKLLWFDRRSIRTRQGSRPLDTWFLQHYYLGSVFFIGLRVLLWSPSSTAVAASSSSADVQHIEIREKNRREGKGHCWRRFIIGHRIASRQEREGRGTVGHHWNLLTIIIILDIWRISTIIIRPSRGIIFLFISHILFSTWFLQMHASGKDINLRLGKALTLFLFNKPL